MHSFCIFVLLPVLFVATNGCMFRNCPNAFTYQGKRSSPDAVSKAKFEEDISTILMQDIQECPEKQNGNNVCDFAGSKVCCSIDEYGEIICNQEKTSQDIDFISKHDMNSAELILHNYVAVQSYAPNLKAKSYCVNIGICCKLGKCLTHATCDWVKSEILQANLPYNNDVVKVKSLDPATEELAKLLKLLRKFE